MRFDFFGRYLGHLVLVAGVVGCTAVVDDTIQQGIGSRCTSDSQCQAGTCSAERDSTDGDFDEGICVSSCATNTDCPGSTACFDGLCQKPLRVGAMWVGVSAGGEGWTLTHDEGMQATQKQLAYLSWTKKENIVTPAQIDAAIDDFVAQGVDVIVANSVSQRDETLKKALQYPKVKFLVAQAYKSQGENADSFAAHGEQGWWIAGKVAGSKSLGSKTHRIGYVGSFITPETVRHVTAFYLAAKSVDPQVVLEVDWMGFWADISAGPQFSYTAPAGAPDAGKTSTYYYEELLTRRLIDHGAVVIAHGADNQRTVRVIQSLNSGVFSISNDNPNAYKELAAQANGEILPTGAPIATCLGSPYWNWTPIYTAAFKRMHVGTWTPTNRNEPMTSDVDTTPVGFHLNPIAGVDDSVVRGFAADIATRGWQAIYNGPYETTGQRDKDGDGVADVDQTVAAGDTLQEAEYTRMCWFPKGVVQRVNPDDASTERPALVPDAAFEADPAFAAKRAEMTKAAFPGLSFDCNKNR